jgi:hypothetical protein
MRSRLKRLFFDKRKNEIKKTLEENKIFLDTIAATTIAIAGLAVSIASFYLSYQANKFTAQEAEHQRNLTKINTPSHLKISKYETSHSLALHNFEIENLGGPALNPRIQTIAFTSITLPYEEQTILECRLQEYSNPKVKFFDEDSKFLRFYNESEFHYFYDTLNQENKEKIRISPEFKAFYKITYENVENNQYHFFIEANKFDVHRISEDEWERNLTFSHMFKDIDDSTIDIKNLSRSIKSLLIDYDLKNRDLNCTITRDESYKN